jgi:hypothetical protein
MSETRRMLRPRRSIQKFLNESAMNVATARDALIGPLRNVYGVSDKVLAMALAGLLIGAGKRRPLWFRCGASFVVIDTLVHNFLHRTSIPHEPAWREYRNCLRLPPKPYNLKLDPATSTAWRGFLLARLCIDQVRTSGLP